uniref:Cysteine protease n=2 Tax=Aplanochytrium stocchinoi TaxID=215587 RepID=A0A7S3PFP9_9STRA|mmetsp:Transcript_9505/g.12340  ORF Transcript_9505/g.12340 Transcript_9505/m.12340 type:complete len:461 (+) Transcript_9505:119-1501(+)
MSQGASGTGRRKGIGIGLKLSSSRSSISWLYDSFYTARNTMEGLANALSSLSHTASTTRINAGKGGCPVYLFEEKYNVCSRSDNKASEETVRFLRHFKSVVWLTYRKNFFPIQPPLGYTSDTGWGCMLRSAQMILAEALQRHLGGKWRYIQEEVEDEETMVITAEHRKLLRWFIDAPKFFSFYSIHRMSECGRRYGKNAGEWYGPTTVAWVLRDLVEAHRTLKKETKESEEFVLLSGGQQQLTMLVADQGTIYVDDVRNLCEVENNRQTGKKENDATELEGNDPLLRPGVLPVWSTALFLLIPVRLGLNYINPDYIPALLKILKFPQCVGMIGGKPSHSLFFIGSQDTRLLYLDPHTVHDAATNENCEDTSFPDKENITTYHCNDPKLMAASEIDPSLAIGFYCKSVGDFMDLRGRIGQLEGPVFLSVMDKKPSYDFDDPEEGEDAEGEEEDDDEWYDIS